MMNKNNHRWLVACVQLHLADEEWKLPRKENDRRDLTYSHCQNLGTSQQKQN
jgi:hypothetical protein